jgi:hypothetical protein
MFEHSVILIFKEQVRDRVGPIPEGKDEIFTGQIEAPTDKIDASNQARSHLQKKRTKHIK